MAFHRKIWMISLIFAFFPRNYTRFTTMFFTLPPPLSHSEQGMVAAALERFIHKAVGCLCRAAFAYSFHFFYKIKKIDLEQKSIQIKL